MSVTTGDRLRAWRRYRKFTLEELATRLEYPASSLSCYERGKRPRLPAAIVEGYIHELGITPNEFYGPLPD